MINKTSDYLLWWFSLFALEISLIGTGVMLGFRYKFGTTIMLFVSVGCIVVFILMEEIFYGK